MPLVPKIHDATLRLARIAAVSQCAIAMPL